MLWEYLHGDHTHQLNLISLRRWQNGFVKSNWIVCSVCKFKKGPFFNEEQAQKEIKIAKNMIKVLEYDD